MPTRTPMPTRLVTVLIVSLLLIPAFAAEDRWFRLGFTPFNYDITDEAQQEVYSLINPRQDVIAHHLDDGVPWPEAAAGDPYDPNVEANLGERLASTPPGMTIYLATTPLNSGRDGLADYWGKDANMPRPGPWADRTFDDPEVIEAYFNWCRDLIDRFQPLYFNYAIEANELARNAPEKWDALMTLVRAVYPKLKREYPKVQIFVSITLRDPGTSEWEDSKPFITEVMDHSQMMAVSTYRYIFGAGENKGDPSTLPPDWLSAAADLAPDKPFAIAETGWLAETLWVPDWSLYVPGNPAWQNDYVTRLFTDANALNARFVIWFIPVDYDNLYNWMLLLGQATPTWLLWKDTGLWDGTVAPRPSLPTWEAWKARSRAPVPPPVPDGAAWSGSALTVEPATGEEVTVTWDSSTCPAAGYHLLWLDLRQLPAYQGVDEVCAAGTSGSWTGLPPAGSALGVLAIADDGGGVEGSHGVDSRGFERPSVSTACGLTLKLTDGICAP